MDGSSPPETTITSKSTSSYTQIGLSPNTKHSFTVTTYKNDSATSTEFKTEALGSCYTYSTPVTVMTAEATGPKTVKLTWTKPKSDEWYQLYIYRDGSKIDWWDPSHTNTYSYDVSAGGTSYTYKIVTLNTAGVLNESAAISKTLTTPPESVSNLALYSNTSSSITLTWTKPGGNSSNWKSSYNPVSNVNWYQAIAFCNKLSVMQGLTPCYKNSSYSDSYWLNVTHDSYPTNYQISYDFTANGYHLPTECQWELAGHGGKKGATDWNYKYPGSDGDRSPIAHAGGKSSYTTVGSLGASCLGLYDMVGNVREWTSDWWSGENNRTTGNLVDPAYSWYTSWATESLGIIVKGCDYTSKGTSDGSIDSKCWGLHALTPSTADKKTGFRLCRNVTY